MLPVFDEAKNKLYPIDRGTKAPNFQVPLGTQMKDVTKQFDQFLLLLEMAYRSGVSRTILRNEMRAPQGELLFDLASLYFDRKEKQNPEIARHTHSYRDFSDEVTFKEAFY